MHDLARDWRRWSVIERAAVSVGVAVSFVVAVIGLLV
jgi:hypothetical protein